MSERLRRYALAVLAATAAVTGLPLTADAVAAAAARAPGDVVTVTLESLEPRDVTPDSAVTVTAVLRNTGPDPTGPLVVRLRRGWVLDTRGELQEADATPPTTAAAAGESVTVDPGLAPGQQRRVRYRTTIGGLGLSPDSLIGVYPVALTVQGEDTGAELGRVSTLLPYLRDGIPGIRVALLWPLLDRPHRLTGTPAGRAELFSDDQLARSVSRGGRLDLLLAAAEKVPAGVRLTLVLDPETVEALDRMTSGYRVGSGSRSTPGRGAAAADGWLDRLRAIAPRHLVVATPYADPDVVALQRGGNAALARHQQPDLEATARVLGVPPTTKVFWPPDEQLTGEALDDVVAQGAGAVVLDPTALPGAPATGRTPSGVSPLPALSGQAVALVGDQVTQGLVGAGGRKNGYAGGPRLAEQRLLAELAMITAEAPSDIRTVVLAPPRRWDPPAGYAAALAADLGRLSWLSSVDALQAAGSREPVDRGALVYPPGARKRELPARQLAAIDTVQAQVADFRGALDNADANAELGPYTDALRRAGSSAWRPPAPGGQAYADRLLTQIRALRGAVTMSEPATGDYTLASSDSPLLVTLENRLSVPVNVRIRLTAPAGFDTRDAGVERIGARSKRTIRVLASVQRTGTFAVKGRATTPGGGPLGSEVTLSVRSTAYGGLALGITGLAFAVLVGAVLFRLFRRLRARSRTDRVGAGGPADRRST